MSIITEEERRSLRSKTSRELAEIIRERKPYLSEKTINSLSENAKAGLKREYFYILNDKSKTASQMANELGLKPKTIYSLRRALISLGAIEKKKRGKKADYNKEYAKSLDELGKQMYEYLVKTPVSKIEEDLEAKNLELSPASIKEYAACAKAARNRLDLYLKGKSREEILEMVDISPQTIVMERRALSLLFPESKGRMYKKGKYTMDDTETIMLYNVEEKTIVINPHFALQKRGAKKIAIYDPRDGEWETWKPLGNSRKIRIPHPIREHLGIKPGDKIRVAYIYK